MEAIFNIPAIFKIICVFCLIIAIIRFKFSLGTALLAGSLVLGFWSRMNVMQIGHSIISTISQSTTITLNAIVVLILILSHSMDKLNQMKRLLSTFQGLVKNARLNLVFFPAIIGLLPMPGGAIFSAPMVDVMGRRYNLDAEHKSLINYWFRHVWEFAWPLYPGPLLAASLASISIWTFVSRAFPLTIVSMVIGSFFLLRKIKHAPVHSDGEAPKPQLLLFLKELAPIAVVIVGAMLGSLLMGWLQRNSTFIDRLPTEIPLIFSLVLSILLVWKVNQASFSTIRSILRNKALLNMIYMVTTIYIFKGILVDSRTVDDVSAFLAAQNIPLVLVFIILPWLVGLIGGIAIAFVGTTFPVLISLLQTVQLEGGFPVSYLILAFSAGFMGVMLSPLHVCLIFTQQYFQANFRVLYQYLWKLTAVMLVSGILYFAILQALGG